MKRIVFVFTLFFTLGLIFSKGLSAEMIRIGEIQTVSHPALNNDSKGFKAALKEEGFIEGKNIVIDRKNAKGDRAQCELIAQKFVDNKVDLVHAIATLAAQVSVKAINNITIVFSSVTDPVASGIIPILGKTGTHVTGVSDMWPIKLQCKMYQELVPHAKRWGTIYNPSDVNVTFHIKEMKEAIEKMGGTLIEAHVSNSSEVKPAAQSLADKVDAIHITSDNTTVSVFETIAKVCNNKNIPLFAGDRDSVPRGAIAAYGLDYFMVGYSAGKVAARILKGEKPGDISAGIATGYGLWVSLKNARLQGVKLPETLLEKTADRLWDKQGNIVKGKWRWIRDVNGWVYLPNSK